MLYQPNLKALFCVHILVSDRERKRKVYDTLEMGDEQTFKEPEV